MEETADQTGEKQKATTFDDLFGDLFQTGKAVPGTETAQLLEGDAEPTSTADLIEYDSDEDKALAPLEKLPAFHSLVGTASAKGFISKQEIVAQLSERYVERFIRYAIDHEIAILETDPLAELVKEEPPGFEIEEDEVEIDLLRLYQYDVGQFPLLCPEEEMALAQKIERAEIARWRLDKGDGKPEARMQLKEQIREGEKARTRFIEGNLRLVIYWAMRHQDQGLELIDMIQEGNLGLMKAVDKFDYRQGCRFSTYASWWIKQAITRGIAEQSRLIRLPVYMHETVRRFEALSEQLTKELGRDPTSEEIALGMGLLAEGDGLAIERAKMANQQLDPSLERKLHKATNKVKRIARIAQDPLSLDMVIDDNVLRGDGYLKQVFGLEELISAKEKSLCLADLAASKRVYDPLGAVSLWSLREQLDKVLRTLSKRQRHVVELRFGLKDGQERTLEEIGQEFGLTRERIRQIEAQALARLRHPIRSRGLRGYVDWKAAKCKHEEATEESESSDATKERESVVVHEDA
jgi:RNA polymerase primary sigma factor